MYLVQFRQEKHQEAGQTNQGRQQQAHGDLERRGPELLAAGKRPHHDPVDHREVPPRAHAENRLQVYASFIRGGLRAAVLRGERDWIGPKLAPIAAVSMAAQAYVSVGLPITPGSIPLAGLAVTASGMVTVPITFTLYLRSASSVSPATVHTKLSSIS
jgi:hypothetical protein